MSGRISHETIDLVRNSSDMLSIVGDYTKLTRKGSGDYWGCCPFHNEKSASFHVDLDSKFYYCFGCHAKGDIITFIMEIEKLSYVEAIEFLAKKTGIGIKYESGFVPDQNSENLKNIKQTIELYDRTANMFHYMLMETEQGKFALDYIKKRGLTDETLKKFKIGYAPADRYWLKKFLKGKNFSDKFLNESGLFSKNYKDISFFNDRLMFPIFDKNSQVVAFGGRILHPQGKDDRKYLNSPEMPHYKKREVLFGFNFAKNAIRENKKAIICEGYMDCIAYHQCGIEYAVAPLGTALTDDQVKMLQRFADEIYLSFDSDSAGQEATKKHIYLCRKYNLTVKVIQLKGGKDPAEIMLNYGKENLTNQVNSAILDSDYLLNILGKMFPTDTPEGKTRAALEYFPYIDSLQSDILKESCLEQLCQTFNLKAEAVKKDFNNRNQAKERLNIRQNQEEKKETQLTINAELRGLIAVIKAKDQFNILRSSLNENDFKNPSARELFRILEECFVNQTYSMADIVSKCNDSALAQKITSDIFSDIYQSKDIGQIVQDTIKYVTKNKLNDQRNALSKRIREFVTVTEDDKEELNRLLEKKKELDLQAQKLL